jgi:hypothetical protein
MRITRELRREINAAVRANVRGGNPLAEVGYRDRDVTGRRNDTTANALLWPDDSDLFDMRRLADVTDIDDDPAHPGCAELDLYVTTGIGDDRELETNVGILIRDGHVVFASDHGRKVTAYKRAINFPLVPWDDLLDGLLSIHTTTNDND